MVRHTAVHVAVLSLLLTLGFSAYSADVRGFSIDNDPVVLGGSRVPDMGASDPPPDPSPTKLPSFSSVEDALDGRNVVDVRTTPKVGSRMGGQEAGVTVDAVDEGLQPPDLGQGAQQQGVGALGPARGNYGIDLSQGPGGFPQFPALSDDSHADRASDVSGAGSPTSIPGAFSTSGAPVGDSDVRSAPPVGGFPATNPALRIAELNVKIADLERKIRDLEGQLTKAILQGAEAKEEITHLRSELGEARTQSDAAPRTGAGKAAAGLMDGIFGLFGF